MSKRKTQEEFLQELKDKNIHITPLEEYVDAHTNIKVKCNDCGEIFYRSPMNILNQVYPCRNCYKENIGKKFIKSEEEFINELKELNSNIELIDRYGRCKEKANFKCKICGAVFKASPTTLLGNIRESKNICTSNPGCPCCAGKLCIEGINDIATTRPDLAKFFKDAKDSKKYTKSSNKKVWFKCLDFGGEVFKKITDINKYGFTCPYCDNDKISYPNKFCRAFLKQLPIENLIPEYSPKWAGKKAYDAYFVYNKKQFVLEADGDFHYRSTRFSKKEDVQKRDMIKDELAKEHEIEVIRIDCRISDKEYIKNNIFNSKLSEIFDLSSVDWNLCELQARKSYIKEVANIYNDLSKDKRGVKEVHNIFNEVCEETIRKYLKIAASLGLCDYDPVEGFKSSYINYPVDVYDENKKLIYSFESCRACGSFLKEKYNKNYTDVTIKHRISNDNWVLYNGFYFRPHVM